jgi:tetratricopeptide (TPR) repeat protein
MTAKMALLRIYAGPERRYTEAFELGRDLVQRYPGNPEVYFATAHAASEIGRFSEAMEIARGVLRQIEAAHPRFPPELLPRYYQLLGKLYMDHGEHAMALASFDRAIQSRTPSRYRWVTTWAWVRSGMVHDVLGERGEAVRRYREALALQADGLAADLARRYLDAPYRARAAS